MMVFDVKRIKIYENKIIRTSLIGSTEVSLHDIHAIKIKYGHRSKPRIMLLRKDREGNLQSISKIFRPSTDSDFIRLLNHFHKKGISLPLELERRLSEYKSI